MARTVTKSFRCSEFNMEKNDPKREDMPIEVRAALPRVRHKGKCEYNQSLRFSMGVIELYLCDKCSPCTCVHASVGYNPIINQTEHCKIHGKGKR